MVREDLVCRPARRLDRRDVSYFIKPHSLLEMPLRSERRRTGDDRQSRVLAIDDVLNPADLRRARAWIPSAFDARIAIKRRYSFGP